MSMSSIIMAVGVIACVVIGSLFVASYYTKDNKTYTDTYGNTTNAASNQTVELVTNVAATGTSVESGFFLFVAVVFAFGFIAYFALKRY